MLPMPRCLCSIDLMVCLIMFLYGGIHTNALLRTGTCTHKLAHTILITHSYFFFQRKILKHTSTNTYTRTRQVHLKLNPPHTLVIFFSRKSTRARHIGNTSNDSFHEIDCAPKGASGAAECFPGKSQATCSRWQYRR